MLAKLKEKDLPAEEWERLVSRWVLSRRDREIVRLALYDNLTAEKIAEEVDMSPRQINRILKRIESTLLNHA